MTRHLVSIVLLIFGTPVSLVRADEASEISAATISISGQFERLDINHDRRLGLDEFLQRGGRPSVLKRDFNLYDLDSNDSLSRSEFASVFGLTHPTLRGKMPDPMDNLVAEAVAALDQSYDDWNKRPSEFVNAHTFVAKFIASISDGGKRYVTGRLILQADRDADGRMSRAEAKRFIQQQLGVRWHNGPLLREPTGRLVRFNHFVDVDEDRNDQLSRQEFSANWWNQSSVDRDFLVNDRDANGHITYLEFADDASQNYFDPVEWFRDADTDLDAFLDAGELAAATSDSRQRLVASTLSAFDDDHNGKLSLQEYRLSMHANVNYSWDARPVDLDHDGRLSYDEFVFNKIDLFQLQRRYYFHRLDQDGDGQLSSREFEFKTKQPFTIHLQSVGRSESRPLYQDLQYPQCGWPSVSPDGKLILFQRCPPTGCVHGRIVQMDVDGRGLRELCDGTHPSWSADGQRFVCERKADGDCVWIMNADGWSGTRVADGRAPKWSPDGETIAYLHDNGVWVYDVRRGETRQVFCREDHRYQDLGDDIAWSPAGNSLAILGNLGKASDLLIIPLPPHPGLMKTEPTALAAGTSGEPTALAAGAESDANQPLRPEASAYGSRKKAFASGHPATLSPAIPATPGGGEGRVESEKRQGDSKPRVRHSFETVADGNLNWAIGDGIMISMHDGSENRSQLFAIAADDDSLPQRMEQFAGGRDWKSACVTPDGKWYIAVSEN